MSGKKAAQKRKAPVRRSKSPKARLGFGGWLKRIFKWGLISGLVLGVLAVIVIFVAYQRTEIPDPNKAFQTQTTNVYYDNGKSKVGTFAQQNRESISYDEMPTCMKEGVVAAENRSFWTDRGLDPKGILRAAFSNAQSGQITGGASTITQQYVKVLYLNQERTYQRKIKEAFLSIKLHRSMSKQEILEGYLNTIYFGRGAYGIEAASQAFFSKPASKLKLSQCAVLSAVINNPSRMEPERVDDTGVNTRLLQRYRYILNGMVDMGHVTAAEAAEASAALPKMPKRKQSSAKGGQKGHMLTLVEDELNALGFTDQEITGGGLQVTTTFNKDAMANAAAAVREVAPTTARDGSKITDKQLHAAVASVEPGTGKLIGFYGGQDFLKSELNWAVQGGMVGSTMKPFTTAAALEAGFSIRDTFDGNSPYTFPGSTLQVRNSGQNAGIANGKSYGSAVNGILAMEQSINTAFVDMTNSIPDGTEKVYELARAAGIPGQEAQQKFPGIPATSGDFYPEDTLITLGKAQISPINMANAYATIAAGGLRADVHVVTKVVDRTGEVRYQHRNNTTRVMDEDVAADVSYTLQRTVTNGTGAKARALGRPAAGKTGTATAPRCGTCSDTHVSSAWFVGYTPEISTAVMYVRGKGREALDGWMPSYYGSEYPARTWLAMMTPTVAGTEITQFPAPAYVDGEAPKTGHEPSRAEAPAAPKPSKKPKPTKSPSARPTTTAPVPSPTQTPTQAPVDPEPSVTPVDPPSTAPVDPPTTAAPVDPPTSTAPPVP